MGKHPRSCVVICPFYNFDEASTIACEGACAGNNLKLSFASKAGRVQHKRKYCETWRYDECLIAKVQLERYRQLEEQDKQ